MKLKIAICDSEIGWHERMEEFLNKTEAMWDVPREFEHFYGEQELLQFLGEPIDILFTNVQLKDGNGIALAGRINNIWPECQIVYVTDDLSYAIDVYQTEHAYYLPKDEIEARLESVLSKTLNRVISGRHRKKRVMFSVKKGEQLLLSPEEIFYFERRKRVTVVVTTIGTYEIRDNLDSIQKIIFQDEFIRCHTSYIVHLSAVRALEGNSFLMRDGSWVPISRGYVKTVKNMFDAWIRKNVMSVNVIKKKNEKVEKVSRKDKDESE